MKYADVEEGVGGYNTELKEDLENDIRLNNGFFGFSLKSKSYSI